MRSIFVFVLVLLVSVSVSATDQLEGCIEYLRKTVIELDKDQTSVSAGFVDYIENHMHRKVKRWSSEEINWLHCGICHLSEDLRKMMRSNKKEGVLSLLEKQVNDFIDTARSVNPDHRSKLSEKITRSASNASSNCEKKTISGKQWMHVYGYRTWYPETGADTTIGWCPGFNSCAWTASAIFRHAGKYMWSGSVSSFCWGLGWKKTTDYGDINEGDVIWWGNESASAGRHVGIYTGWGRAVSNNWRTGKPCSHSAKNSPGFMGFGGKPFKRGFLCP